MNKPQHIIDAENRYKHMKAICEYIEQNRIKYAAIVKYAQDNWNTLNNYAGFGGVSVADQLQMYADCPYIIAEDVARMVSIHKN